MLRGCVPVLGFDSWVREPRMFVAEVLHNYVRSSSRQSGIFDITSFTGDVAQSDSDVNTALTTIRAHIEEYLKKELDDVNVVINAERNEYQMDKYDTFVTVEWSYQGVHDRLEKINLNNLMGRNI